MGKCEYVDDNANFLDGWHCTIIKGRVDDPDIVGYYCKSSTACEYCPYRGGDDRYRKQKNEPARSERSEESYDQSSSSTGGVDGSSSSRKSGGSYDKYGIESNKKVLGVVILLFALLCVFVFIAAKCGAFRSTVNLYLDLPENVNHKELSLIAVSLDPEHLYETEEKKFSEDGNCSLKIRDGQNLIYISYNGVSVYIGDAVGDSSSNFMRDDFSYEDLQTYLFRTLVIDLQDTEGAPIENAALQVESKNGEDLSWLQLDADTYVIIFSNTNTAPVVAVKAEGYKEIEITADLTEERVEKMLLTLLSDKEVE